MLISSNTHRFFRNEERNIDWLLSIGQVRLAEQSAAMRQATYNAVIRLRPNIELLRFWAWGSFNQLRCGQNFLMGPYSGGSNTFPSIIVLKPMIRCGKKLFQITSIGRCSVGWLIRLGQNIIAKHSIAFKLAVITKVRQGLKHLVLQREFPWCFFFRRGTTKFWSPVLL